MAIVDVSKIPNNSKFDPVREAILELEGNIVSGIAGVASINGQTGTVNIVAGSNITLSASAGAITINSTATGGGTLDGVLTLAAGGGIRLSSPSVFDGSTDLTVTITNTDRPNDGELTFTAGAGLSVAGGTSWEGETLTWGLQSREWATGQSNVFSANTADDVAITLQHEDTSNQASLTNADGVVIQSVGLDTFGHVQSMIPVNLDLRYKAFRTFITEDDNDSIVADTYNDTITFDGSASIAVTKDANLKKINIGLSLSDIRFDNGVRIARGFIYWQEQGQPTSADTPTASTFDFTTGKITINDSSWDQVPPLTGSSITEYYIARYESRDDGAGTSAARTVTYDDPIEATGFEGPVTFNSLAEELGGNGLTIIDGGRIKTGRVQSLELNAVDYDANLSVYTGEGTLFDLENGDLVSEEFSIVNGNANFKGDLSAASGTFGTVRINKEVGGTDYAIFSSGFALDTDGNVTIGGVSFPVIIFADDAAGNNRSLTQGDKEYALFTSSTIPPEDLTQEQIDAFTGTFVTIVGQDGADGAAGIDGLSPTVDSVKVGDTTTITIYYDQNQNGVYDAGIDTLIDVFTVQDGVDGVDGIDGQNGQSPTVSTSKVGNTTTVTVFYDVNSNGVYDAGTDVLLDQFTVEDGDDGLAGTDGISTFLASIYRRSASAPATPSGGSYNFGTTTLTPPSGWSITVPSGTDPLYVSTALANIQGTDGTDTTLNWSTPVILARDGADGADGADGINGTDGVDGSNGVKTATGIVFYEFGSVSEPTAPIASYFDFDIDADPRIVGLTSGWSINTPDMEAGTSTNRYWSSYYVAIETSAGSGIGSISFENPQRSFSFNQVVTFSSLDTAGQTVINGENITTGIIKSADYIAQSGSVFSADGMAINLDALSIETPSFAIDGNGDAYFSSGDIAIGSNKITLKAQNLYSSLGEIEFQNETGAMAANMRATSYGTNEVTIASYVSGTTKGNQLILGAGAFYLGRSNGSFIQEDSDNFLRMFGDAGIKMISLPFLSTSANMYVNPSTGQIYRTTSSLRYKRDIEDYTRGVDDLKKLRPVSFKSIDQDSDTVYAGFIAEEVHESGLTEYVDYNENNEPDAIHYANLVTLLTKAVQEQQQQIDLLKSEVEALKNKTS